MMSVQVILTGWTGTKEIKEKYKKLEEQKVEVKEEPKKMIVARLGHIFLDFMEKDMISVQVILASWTGTKEIKEKYKKLEEQKVEVKEEPKKTIVSRLGHSQELYLNILTAYVITGQAS